MDFRFLPKTNKIKKCNKLVCNIYEKEICCAYKSFKTNIKLRINTKKSTQINSV